MNYLTAYYETTTGEVSYMDLPKPDPNVFNNPSPSDKTYSQPPKQLTVDDIKQILRENENSPRKLFNPNPNFKPTALNFT